MLNMCLTAFLVMMSMLPWLMGMIICFLEEPLVVILILGLCFRLVLWVMLCILIIFLGKSFGKTSLIFNFKMLQGLR